MHDHVTLLSPARIERGIARHNFTPILSGTRSSGFNVFGLRMGLRSTGLKASEHGGSDARAAGCQSRSGVPYRHPPNFLGSTSFVLRFRSRSPALWAGVCQLPPTRRLANFRVARIPPEVNASVNTSRQAGSIGIWAAKQVSRARILLPQPTGNPPNPLSASSR